MASRSKFQFGSIALVLSMLASLVLISPAPAGTATALITCVNLQTGTERISRTGSCPMTQAVARWRLVTTDSGMRSGGTTKTLTICSNKKGSFFNYQIIRTNCSKIQQRDLYTRSGALPEKPTITKVVSASDDSAALTLATDPATNLDSPIAYYTITSSKGDTKRIYTWKDLTLILNGLRSSTSYTFTATATNADGTSPISSVSIPVTTLAYIPPVTNTSNATPLAAPAFTLSSTAETKMVNSAISGYTITSTGGAIASYSISPAAPAGLTFNSSTGLLSGIPTSIKSATVYTITATNMLGSASRTFTLTATAFVYSVGDTGPAGGKIFYVSSAGFACGPSLNLICTYLEAAPSLWNSGTADPIRTWANTSYQSTTVNNASTPETATATEIGWGYRNTRAIILQGNTDTATSAAALADSFTVTVSSVVYDDWYLPSKDELVQLDLQKTTVGGLKFYDVSSYWSSSEHNAFEAQAQDLIDGCQCATSKSAPGRVRPIRAGTTLPAFTLSNIAETVTANTTAITGYTIASTGGIISGYSISPSAPAGLVFNTSTGILSGTPTSVASATPYTVTATNASGSATRTFTLTVSAVVYTVGSTGPGGGKIFYVAATPFACGPTRAAICSYLEVAPSLWNGGAADPQRQWASANQSTAVPGITDDGSAYNNSLAIGLGYKNSLAIVAQGSDATSAAGAARAYAGGSKSDWYLPTTAELNLLCQWSRGVTQDVTTGCTGGSINSATYGASAAGLLEDKYWSSSEGDSGNAWFQDFRVSGVQNANYKYNDYCVRPIRAF